MECLLVGNLLVLGVRGHCDGVLDQFLQILLLAEEFDELLIALSAHSPLEKVNGEELLDLLLVLEVLTLEYLVGHGVDPLRVPEIGEEG